MTIDHRFRRVVSVGISTEKPKSDAQRNWHFLLPAAHHALRAAKSAASSRQSRESLDRRENAERVFFPRGKY